MRSKVVETTGIRQSKDPFFKSASFQNFTGRLRHNLLKLSIFFSSFPDSFLKIRVIFQR